jgi:hypothetical protein
MLVVCSFYRIIFMSLISSGGFPTIALASPESPMGVGVPLLFPDCLYVSSVLGLLSLPDIFGGSPPAAFSRAEFLLFIPLLLT